MSTFYLIVYFAVWLLTYLLYRYRTEGIGAGRVIILTYTVLAALAVLLYNIPQPYADFRPVRLFPFLYLFVMLRLALCPVTRFETQSIHKIETPDLRILKAVALAVTACSLLMLPELAGQLHSGAIRNLLTDPSAGKELYSEALSDSDVAGYGISNLPAIIVNAFSDISVLLMFYFLTLKERPKWVIGCLIFVNLCTLCSPIFSGQRGNVIYCLMTWITAYCLLYRYMPAKIRHWINVGCVVVLCLIAIPLVAITASRFKDREGGSLRSVIYYAGQAPINFNNYGLDAGGIRHGDRTFNLVKRLIDPATPKNYDERRNKYYYLLMDDNVFYTFVGDFTLDFGPYIAPVIFIIFTILVLLCSRPRGDTIAFHRFLLVYFVACICMQGSMTLFTYADTAGLRIVVLFALYLILSLTRPKPTENEVCQTEYSIV